MKLSRLFNGAGITLASDVEDVEIKNIVTDSRKAQKGSLYICIKGLHTDGHEMIGDAIRRGASVILAEHGRDVFVGGAAIIKIENTRSATALLYNAYYGDPAGQLKIIGITGTNGKTSVCSMLCSIFERAGMRCGTVGTLGCYCLGRRLASDANDPLANMTTPDPEVLYRVLSEMADGGCDTVVMEVSSHALALFKCDAIHFDTAIFTNLGRDHLDFHGSVEEYFQAKKQLFERCGRAIINTDGQYGQRLAALLKEEGRVRTVTVSEGADSDMRVCDIGHDALGRYFYSLSDKDGSYRMNISLPISGSFSVSNSALAALAATEYGIDTATVEDALSRMSPISGRMERVDVGYSIGFSVYIDYAHTPDALECVLKNAPRKENGRIILLFGCGGERDRGKRKLMGHVASTYSHFTVITSDNSRGEDMTDIFSDILKGIDKEKPYILIPDRAEAIRYAVSVARDGDCVILAGKGHEKYEIDRSGKHYFDEMSVARDAIERRYNKNK